MTSAASSDQTSGLERELDAAVTAIEAAFTEAERGVASIRSLVPQIVSLATAVGEMETTMERVRHHLDTSTEAPTREAPELRAIHTSEPPAGVPEGDRVAEAGEPQPDDSDSQPDGRPHCLRVDVKREGSSLDLKTVDEAVNANPSVVDVALLDYDGSHATLKIWVEATAEPDAVRTALLENLLRSLDGEEGTEVSVDLVEQSAA